MLQQLLIGLLLALPAGVALGQHGAVVEETAPVNSFATNDTVHDSVPRFAMDDHGNGVVFWQPSWLLDIVSPGFPSYSFKVSCRPAVTRTSDHGKTWSGYAPFDAGSIEVGRVDTVAVGGNGSWITAWNTSDTFEGTADSDNDIAYSRSTDGGRTWSAASLVIDRLSEESVNPHIASDNAGNWVVTWQKDSITAQGGSSFTGIQVMRSTDDGLTWDSWTELIDRAPVWATHFNTGPRAASNGSGTWIVAWSSSASLESTGSDTDVLYSRSADNGATWSQVGPVNNDATVDFGDVDGAPEIAVDSSGNWIVIWLSRLAFEDDSNIMFATSADDGLTWTDPVLLETDFPDGNVIEYATVDVDDHGNWVVTWQERQLVGSYIYPIYVTRSSDMGTTWTARAPLNADATSEWDGPPILANDNMANWLMVWASDSPVGGTVGDDPDILATSFRFPFQSSCPSDSDADGFGTAGDASCPLGAALDCEDTNFGIAPGAKQVCDGLNNDCAHPSWPALGATNEFDDDGDGFSECAGDCDDSDPFSSSIPGVVESLTMGKDLSGGAVLQWDPPADTGGSASVLVYDVVRSETPFPCEALGTQICLEADDPVDRFAEDSDTPASGSLYFYQVRVENGCPGPGRVGTDASVTRPMFVVECNSL